jgi:hypothetical protein
MKSKADMSLETTVHDMLRFAHDVEECRKIQFARQVQTSHFGLSVPRYLILHDVYVVLWFTRSHTSYF